MTIQTMPVARRAYRINEACHALGISRGTAYNMMASGALPYTIIGGRRHISADVVEALVRGDPIPLRLGPARRRKRAAA